MSVKKGFFLIGLLLLLSSCQAEKSLNNKMHGTDQLKTTISYWDEEKKIKKELISYSYSDDGSRMKHGKYTSWYQNGQIETELNYKKNKLHGSAIKYYENGEVEFKGLYKNDKKDGKWLEYYENGQLTAEIEYKNGVKDGETIGYHDNGQKDFQGFF